jgi:protoheme ferro-lyase
MLDIGMPASPKEAGAWLTELYADPHVLQTSVAGPFLDLLAWYTSLVRRSALSSALEAVGGQAPEKAELEKLVAALALGLGGRLSRAVQPFVAFRHAKPGIVEALQQAQSAGCRRVVGVFARTFASSAGSDSMRAALALAAEDLPDLDVSMVDAFEDDAAIRASFAAEAKEALANVPESERAGAHLLFLLQGQPVKERRDPTLPRAQLFAQAVKDAMGVANPSTFAYQTGVDPRAPLLPDAAEEIARLAGQKCRALVLIPLSHACEGLATRWELDLGLVKLARELGIAHVSRANAPSGSPTFRAALEDLVKRHLDDMGRYRATTG